MKYTYKMFEDNAGFHHLAIMDDRDACVYYLADQDEQLVKGTLGDLLAGGDPIAEAWEGGENDPQSCLASIELRGIASDRGRESSLSDWKNKIKRTGDHI